MNPVQLSLSSPRHNRRNDRRPALLAALALVSLVLCSTPAFALLVGDDGQFEPIIVQIKDSLRTSTDLDSQLAALGALEQANGLSEVGWYAGRELLVTLSFPKASTEAQAQATISLLQLSPAVEKVVVQSAANLEYKAADFANPYLPGQTIPDATRRGFDADRLLRPAVIYDAESELPLHVANEIIVRWKDESVWNAGQTGLDQQFAIFNAQAECTVVKEWRYSDHDLAQVLEFDPVKYSVLDQLLLYQGNDLVDYVQPNYLYEAQSVPNDPFYNGYQKVYPLGKISAESAWDSTTGSDSIIAAVLDTGANVASTNGHVAHPDFTPNLWSGQNNGEKHNFSENGHATTDVYDYEADQFSGGLSHGSNVASIIGARGSNDLYMCGLSQKVKLMILKVLPTPKSGVNLNGKTSVIVDAVNYAVAHGARVMNMSFGQYFCLHQSYDPGPPAGWYCDIFGLDAALLTALKNAKTSGVVAVCAAGNSGRNNDSGNPFGPANMPTDNVMSVAASDSSDARALFSRGGSSNYGVKTVDLAAPGKAIWGLRQSFNGNGTDTANYSLFEGTSQAAPHVTGTIALLAAKFGWENYHGLRDRVLMGTDDVTAWTRASYVLAVV